MFDPNQPQQAVEPQHDPDTTIATMVAEGPDHTGTFAVQQQENLQVKLAVERMLDEGGK